MEQMALSAFFLFAQHGRILKGGLYKLLSFGMSPTGYEYIEKQKLIYDDNIS